MERYLYTLKNLLLFFLYVFVSFILNAKDIDVKQINEQYINAHFLMRQNNYNSAKLVLDSISTKVPYSLKSIIMSDLAVCYKNLGEINSANKTFIDAISTSTSDLNTQKIKYNYSNFLIEIGDYSNAIDILKGINRQELLPQKLINLSLAIYLKDYNFLEAITILDLCLNLPSLDQKYRAIALQNKGFLYFENNKLKKSLELFTEALQTFGVSDNYYRTLGNIALVNSHLRNYKKSNEQISRVIEHFKRQHSTDYAIALRKAGQIYLNSGDINNSIKYFHSFFDWKKNEIISNVGVFENYAWLNLWQKEKQSLSKCFLLENNDADFLFDVALFRRQTSLLGMSDSISQKHLLSIKVPNIQLCLKKDEAAIEFITYTNLDGDVIYAALLLQPNGEAKFIKLFDEAFLYEPEQVGTNSIFNAIKRDNKSEKDALYTDSSLANKVWGPIISQLSDNITKIYFAPEGIFHFWGIENMPFKKKKEYELHRVTSTALLANRSNILHQSHPKTLVIGGLNYSSLPVDTVSGTPNHEASELLGSKIGRNDIFNYLPGTRSEADSIVSILNKPITSYHIGESELKAIMPNFDIIHIATHGYSLNLGIRKRPEFLNDSIAIDMSLNAAGLALTGANVAFKYRDREDGLLSAREICELDLSNVDFVVLSACQTAQGDLTDEGAAGLVRGLKNAGVNTILATLWSVDDKSTMLFMQEFYRQIEQGASKHDAYIAAQNYLKEYKLRVPYHNFSPATLAREKETNYHITSYNSPYYWAPFILIDDF